MRYTPDDDIYRHLLGLEIPDLLKLSIRSLEEILESETANGLISNIHNPCIGASWRNIAAKSMSWVIGWMRIESCRVDSQQT